MLSVIQPPTVNLPFEPVHVTDLKSASTIDVSEVSDEPRTVDELIRLRAKQIGRTPLVSYPQQGLDYIDYTAEQLDQFAFHASSKYAGIISPRSSSSEPAQVVAILGISSLDYLITTIAISKLGHTVLHLSTRISHEAYISLLQSTNAVLLLADDAMRDTALKCKANTPNLRVQGIAIIADYSTSKFASNTNLTPGLDMEAEQNTVAWIIHSSGSTGLPKPIFQTQKAAMNNYASNMNMRGFITLPLFHAHGISSTFRAIHSCKQIHLYNARIPLTRAYLVELMRKHDFEIFYGVPYVLKLLAEEDEGIELLAKCKIVMFGGSACPDALGDKLVSNGVNLVSHWGSTETGQLMTSFRPEGDQAWNYLRPSEAVKPYLRMEPRGEGLYEAVCLPGWPSKVATNQPDGSYALKDLFMKHPSEDWWKYYGRLDDTIVLVNGEKAMPLTIEGAAKQHPSVHEAVAFGKGRERLGLAVIRAVDTESTSDHELANQIIALVEPTQSIMPAYARITADMILVLDADTQYPRTDKGTVIRMKFYRALGRKIDALYDAQSKPTGHLQLTREELHAFLRSILKEVSPDVELANDDVDFFNAGMDSLQATRLRVAIARNVDIGPNMLGSNVCFDHPSITKLASYLFTLRTGSPAGREQLVVKDQMKLLIDRYSQFRKHIATEAKSKINAVALTGVTGSLGAHIASSLAADPSIDKIYCLVRASSDLKAHQRMIRSIADRGVSPSSSALRKLVALPTNLSQKLLGLSPESLYQLQTEVSTVIHSAWSVNFNLNLSSFEDCISGAHNLIQALCLGRINETPASFNFCSSVSTVVRTKSETITETVPDLSAAQKMGYAQSKLVTEHICALAAERYDLCARVLRIGQIIGDTKHGVWNKQEAIPTMMQSAKTIGALPVLDENPRWLPVDVVAQTCVDISTQRGSLTSSPPSSTKESALAHQLQVSSVAGATEKATASATTKAETYNICNPHTVHWTTDILPTLERSGLQFDRLSIAEWLKRLQASNPDPVTNPPIKLLDFWLGKYASNSSSSSSSSSSSNDDDNNIGVTDKSSNVVTTSTQDQENPPNSVEQMPERKEKKIVGEKVWHTANAAAASEVFSTVDKSRVESVVSLALKYFTHQCW